MPNPQYRGFALPVAGGQTTDAALLGAANAVLALNNQCDVGNSGTTIKQFQAAWNVTSDTNLTSDPGYAQLTIDGYYGQATSDALASCYGDSGVNVPAPCKSYTNIPGGSPPQPPPPVGPPTPIQPVPPGTITTNTTTGLPTWLMWGLGLVIASGLAYIAWSMYKPRQAKKARPHHPHHATHHPTHHRTGERRHHRATRRRSKR
jgi:hypothetical protein